VDWGIDIIPFGIKSKPLPRGNVRKPRDKILGRRSAGGQRAGGRAVGRAGGSDELRLSENVRR
jgi:hypothetical protein